MSQPSHSYSKVILICLSSRLLIFAVQLFANLALPDHSSKDAYIAPQKSMFSRSALDVLLQDYIFSGLNHWDGQWFLSIAVTGTYQEEEKLVFLPLFPLTLFYSSKIVYWMFFGLINPVSAVMVASFIINLLAFCAAGLALYTLTLMCMRCDHQFAEETILWFAYNPASIFFTATYSESIYCALTFSGLAALYSKRIVLSAVLFALSTLTRSNGLLNAGFLLYQLVSLFFHQKRLITTSVSFVLISLSIIISIGPFYWYQREWIPSTFCPGASFCSNVSINKTQSPANSSSLPSINSFLPYTSLQNLHWKQGLFNFYHWRQIPNFLLASPVIALVSVITLDFCFSVINSNRKVLNHNLKHKKLLLPFVLHAFFLILVSVMFLHVQIATRLIFASTPIIYWYASALENASTAHRLTKLFFTSYFFIGAVAFSNQLPWT